jgi:AcrR family transcriptional regulator
VEQTRIAGHRTQAERSASTKARLLDAAIECLTELGYAGLTTTEVARRAGVSRGAQIHHFPTKTDLVVAAVGHLFVRRLDEFRKAFADAPPGSDRLDEAIDLLWSMYCGPAFVSWLELWVAARSDPSLRTVVVDLNASFTASAQGIFSELFPASEQSPNSGFQRLGLAFAFALMDGLALGSVLGPKNLDDQEEVSPAEIIGVLKSVARLALSQPIQTEEHL